MAKRIEYTPPRPAHRLTVGAVLAGLARFAVMVPALLVGTAAVLLASLLPGRIRGARPALWAAIGLTRLFLLVFGVRLQCTGPEAIRRHAGLLFINHLSYLDPLAVLAVGPARFLSAAGVRTIPLIGWMATGVGTVFVNRGDEGSRAASREALVGKLRHRAYPPIVVAPEGQIGPGGRVLPFRHGAFEVAAAAAVPVLPVVVTFDPLEAAAWHPGESIPRAAWRLAARTRRVTATLTPLPLLHPSPSDDVRVLARQLEAAYDAALGS